LCVGIVIEGPLVPIWDRTVTILFAP
jgi:hypothetical protein